MAENALPPGTVLCNPVTGEYTRILEHHPEQAVGKLLAVPGAAVAGPHHHPAQHESFEVVEGRLGYRRGDETGELGPGESLSVARGSPTTGGTPATPTCGRARG